MNWKLHLNSALIWVLNSFYSYSLSPTFGVKRRKKRRVRVKLTLQVKTRRENLHFKSIFKLNFFAPALQIVISPSFVSWKIVARSIPSGSDFIQNPPTSFWTTQLCSKPNTFCPFVILNFNLLSSQIILRNYLDGMQYIQERSLSYMHSASNILQIVLVFFSEKEL